MSQDKILDKSFMDGNPPYKGSELKVLEIPIHPWMDVYVLVHKRRRPVRLTSKASELAKKVPFPDSPDFIEDLAYVGTKAVKEKENIKISWDNFERLEYFVRKPGDEPDDLDFPWVWYDKKFDKTWVYSGYWGRYFLFRERSYDRIKKSFVFPPLWDIFDLKEEQKVHIFPNINGRPFIIVRNGNTSTDAIVWWELKGELSNQPPLSYFFHDIFGLELNPEYKIEQYGAIEIQDVSGVESSCISNGVGVAAGIPIDATVTFDKPLYLSGDISLLQWEKWYYVSKCRSISTWKEWYIFHLKQNSEEEYVVFSARFPSVYKK